VNCIEKHYCIAAVSATRVLNSPALGLRALQECRQEAPVRCCGAGLGQLLMEAASSQRHSTQPT
jgi:hypothetical protein